MISDYDARRREVDDAVVAAAMVTLMQLVVTTVVGAAWGETMKKAITEGGRRSGPGEHKAGSEDGRCRCER